MTGVEGRLGDDVRARIKAYPGDITYLDLMKRNRRESVLLMAGLILLAGIIGAVIVGVVAPYGRGVAEARRSLGAAFDGRIEQVDERMAEKFIGVDRATWEEHLLPSAALGLAAGLLVAGIGAVWSWFGGSSAILRLSGAVPVQKRDDPELYNVVEEMSIAAGLPMPAVYIIPETALNAFATGRDPQHAAVAITTGLRERLNRDELQGVIAHEMAHVRHLDVRFAMLMATMVGLIVFVCDALWRIALHGGLRGAGGGLSGGRRGGKGGGGTIVLVILALVLGILAPIIARFIQMAYSRRREYLADAGAVELTRNPRGLASALLKLSEDREPLIEKANRGTAHMYIVNPLSKMRRSGQGINSIFSSHPPIKERVARLMALER